MFKNKMNKIKFHINYLIFRLLPFLFLILTNSLKINAQSPETPQLCKVSVEKDSIVGIYWYYADTSSIDGFIIKRVIYDGNGVINGTLNNIAILPNTQLFYRDTSQSFDTQANPYIRSEEYSVSAFLIQNDSTILSNMAFPQKTVFLQGEWIFCDQKAKLSWSKYKNRNIDKHIVFYSKDTQKNMQIYQIFSASDTSFELINLQKDTHYFFKVATILSISGSCMADTSWSNIVNFYTTSLDASVITLPVNATVLDNNIEVNFTVNGSQIKNIVLKKIFEGNEIFLKNYENNTNLIHYIDDTQTDKINKYFVQTTDICNNLSEKSKTICNNVLSVNDQNNQYNFYWTGTTINGYKPDEYRVFALLQGNWQEIAQTDGNTNSLQIKFSDFFSQNQFSADLKEISFFIKATKDSITSLSNIVTIAVSGILAIPTAFNPKSNIEEDRFFTIKSMFVKDFSIVIFTPNNELVFQSDDINSRWDGTMRNGVLCGAGAYIYVIEYTSNSGKTDKISGIINLVY